MSSNELEAVKLKIRELLWSFVVLGELKADNPQLINDEKAGFDVLAKKLFDNVDQAITLTEERVLLKVKKIVEEMKVGQNVVLNCVARSDLKKADELNTHNHTLSMLIKKLNIATTESEV